MGAERQDAGRAEGRSRPAPRAGTGAPPVARPERERDGRGSRPPGGRAPARRSPDGRDAGRGSTPHPGDPRRPGPPADVRHTGSSTAKRTTPEPGLRGALAVAGIFLLTLVAAAADSYLGVGLGTITLIALTAATVVAAWVVRRRDLLNVVLAPPLVFVAVTVTNIGLAPSAFLNLPTLATLLVRGFPAMAIATGAAIVVLLVRKVTRG